MERVYVPFAGEKPALVSVNGHNVLLISSDEQELERHLSDFGGEEIRRIKFDEDLDLENPESVMQLIHELSITEQTHLVVTPEGEPLEEILRHLEEQLPWVQ